MRVTAVAFAVAAVALLVVVAAMAATISKCVVGGCARDNFVSERARRLFAATSATVQSNGTFSDFKRAARRAGDDGVDVAQYAGMRRAAAAGALTPEAVQAAL